MTRIYLAFDFFRINKRMEFSVKQSSVNLSHILNQVGIENTLIEPSKYTKLAIYFLKIFFVNQKKFYVKSYYDFTWIHKKITLLIFKNLGPLNTLYFYEGTPALKSLCNDLNCSQL